MAAMLLLRKVSLWTALISSWPPIDKMNFLVKFSKDQNSNPMLPVRATLCTSTETALALENLCIEISSDMPCKILQALTLLSDNINSNMLEKSLQQVQSKHMNPKIFQYNIFAQAKQERQHIVLPEGEESRTIQAAGTLLKNKLCNLTLLGDPEKINELASQFKVDLKCAHIINPLESPLRDKYATMLYEYRKEKGVTKEKAYDLAKDATYFGTLIVAAGDADGMVSGAIHTTADTIRPALQIIKTEPGLIASSVMFICLKDKVQVFADCAVNVEPTSKELAAIAVASAETAMAFGIKPLVAMLSYATGDSNDGPSVQKVRDAKNIALQLQPNLCIEGPLQYDAAVNLTAAKIKLKGQESTVAGKANILVFPELNAGNIAYKAVQQSTGAITMGPLLQGLRKPVNDLSRGCTVDDIISTVVMTALQAAHQKKKPTSMK
ncbi:uncharacterized protein LOC131061425 isoform X2 [Cryptomeria japonica]|uniref:uncharacterized protein LOC131061425 isoform X2 n=1 Tax=Cryptomeria japonica TaxID=3369 RepID=UPI0027DA7254|nr:uncharacterized protein LOC131061425 isoform X2 [Cryptomeria japonica]